MAHGFGKGRDWDSRAGIRLHGEVARGARQGLEPAAGPGAGEGVLPLRGKAGQAPSQTISRVASWRGWERGGGSSAKGRAHWGCFASVWEAQLEELAGDPPPGRLSSAPRESGP